MPLYGGPAASEEITAWARLVVQALRAGGATQPVSLGDGAWGIETTGQRQRLLAARARSARRLPRAALVPDGGRRGASGARARVRVRARRRLRQAGRPRGVRRDLRLRGRRPRRRLLPAGPPHDAPRRCDWLARLVERRLRRSPRRGSVPAPPVRAALRRHRPARPAEAAARRAAAVLAARPRARGRRLGAGAGRGRARRARALRARAARSRREAYRADIRRDLLQAYVAARAADLPGRARRGSGTGSRPARASTSLPCGQAADGTRASTGCASSRTAGATVYLSYFAGSTANQRGPWLTWLDELFGVEHRLRYGLVDPIDGDSVTFEFVAPLGDLEAGSRLTFAVAGEPGARELPPRRAGRAPRSSPSTARAARRSSATELGAGRTILCTYPLEHMAARTPRVNPEATWRLYAALAESAGVVRPVAVSDPRVVAGAVRHGGARDRRPRQLLLRAGRRRAGALHGGGVAARPRPRRAPTARRRRHPPRRRRADRPSGGHGVSRRE